MASWTTSHLLFAAGLGCLLGLLLAWLVLRARLLALQAAHAARQEAQRETFQALAADALAQSQETFLGMARVHLDQAHQHAHSDLSSRQDAIAQLLSPIETGLHRIGDALGQVERQRIDAYAELREQVRAMQQSQAQLQQETRQLVSALRAPQVRGRWGEIQLRRVVEMAGMLDHCDFVEQAQHETADGRLRPDLIVRLPGGKRIIVDAKAPLAAYLDALDAGDDTSRRHHLVLHAQQVRTHMTRLAAKSYWSQFDDTPDMVFMFLPGETFYSAALEHDPALLEYGVEARVIPASPLTLIALLRAVAYGWRQERIAENAQAISDQGAEVYRRMRTLTTHLVGMGAGLSRAVDAYNSAVGSLERSVLPATRRFRDLGVSAAQEIPELDPIDTTLRAVAGQEPVTGEQAISDEPFSQTGEQWSFPANPTSGA